MQITINIPDQISDRVIEAIAKTYNYDTQPTNDLDVNGSPILVKDTMTKRQFLKRVVLDFLKANVKNHEENEAVRTAKLNAQAKADSEITLS